MEDTRTFITGQLEKLAKQEELTAGLFVDGRIAGVIGARLSPLAPSIGIRSRRTACTSTSPPT